MNKYLAKFFISGLFLSCLIFAGGGTGGVSVGTALFKLVDYPFENVYKEDGINIKVSPYGFDGYYRTWVYKVSIDSKKELGQVYFGTEKIGDKLNKGNNEFFTSNKISPSQKYLLQIYSIDNSKKVKISAKFTTRKITQDELGYSPKCRVTTYQDKFYFGVGGHCIEKIRIKGIYFVAKNQTTGVRDYWKQSMLTIFGEIEKFYEKELKYVDIVVDKPVIIYGTKNIEEYNQYTMTEEIYASLKIKDNKKEFLDLMIYPIQSENGQYLAGEGYGGGGEKNNGASATNSWFWLDALYLGGLDGAGSKLYTGYLGSAHEFGHSLGIPHPWEEEVNKNADGSYIIPSFENLALGSLMSYGGQLGPLTEKSFIRDEVKNRMIKKLETEN